MLITRTPLRITLGGGRHRPAVVLRGARRVGALGGDLQAHLHLGQPDLHRRLLPEVLGAGARREAAGDRAPDHPRGADAPTTSGPGVEIVSIADIPAGTGLGSSGSFTVGLLQGGARGPARARQRVRPRRARRATSRSTGSAARSASRTSTSPRSAASPISTSSPTARVDVEPPRLVGDTCHDLEEHLLMFFTGYSRDADQVLSEQVQKSQRRRLRDDRQPPLRQGPRPAEPGGARARRRRRLRGPDARALAGQEEALAVDVQPPDRPPVPRRP